MWNARSDMCLHHQMHGRIHTDTQIPSTNPQEGEGRVVMNEKGGGVERDKRAMHNDT